jgi:Arm DNA-binding domain
MLVGVFLGVLLILPGGILGIKHLGGEMALTDTVIRKAKAKDAAYRLSDGGGLYLWITPAGGKLRRWKYRHDGVEKLMSFGKYPDVPLSLARERHSEVRKLLATGTARWRSVRPTKQQWKTPSKVSPPAGWSTGSTGRVPATWIM